MEQQCFSHWWDCGGKWSWNTCCFAQMHILMFLPLNQGNDNSHLFCVQYAHHVKGWKKKKKPASVFFKAPYRLFLFFFVEHIWTPLLRLNIPNVTRAGNDLFAGRAGLSLLPKGKRGCARWGMLAFGMGVGRSRRWLREKDMASSTHSSSDHGIWLYSNMVRCCVWRCNLIDFHSASRMGGCRSLLPWATTSHPYLGQAHSRINTD